MTTSDITNYRLANQLIEGPKAKTPAQAVGWLGAMQAQDYSGALWAVGLRMRHAMQVDIEKAIADRQIIRTWPMRGTLHFVAATDARWMLELMTPRVMSRMDSRHRQLDISSAVLEASKNVLVKSLHGGKQLTRIELKQVLERANIATANQRGNHILGWHAQNGLICFGSHQGKQPTFVLLDEWVPKTKPIERDEALARLATRYFTSHGPATIADCAWWSGLKMSDVRAGIAMAGTSLTAQTIDAITYWMGARIPLVKHDATVAHLLPPFDEYLVAYRHRDAAIDSKYSSRVNPGSNGMFSPIIVINGRVVGIWKRTIRKDSVIITVQPFTVSSHTRTQRDAIAQAAEGYGAFLGLAARVQ